MINIILGRADNKLSNINYEKDAKKADNIRTIKLKLTELQGKLQREYNVTGKGMDFVRNALMETLESSDFGSKLADQFAEFICGFFNTVAGKGREVMSAINTPKPAAPVAATT